MTDSNSSLKRPILLWHPQIHAFFGETLYFFALRFHGYSKEILYGLRERFQEKGVVGVCLYELFGSYDVLLRAWLTQANLTVAQNIISETRELAATPAVFRVSEMRHWAFPHSPRQEALHEVLGDSENILLAQAEARKGNTDDRVPRYEEEGVTVYAALGEKALFYTALSFGQYGALPLITEQQIRKTLFEIFDTRREEVNAVQKVNVYLGDGFAHALIKGCVENMRDARSFVVDLIIAPLLALVPETTTFAICSTEAIECDDISRDALDNFQRGRPPLWIQEWFPDFYRIGGDDSTLLEVQLVIGENRELIRSISDEDRQRLIQPLLEAVLTQNASRAVEAILPWFAQIEATLGDTSTWFSFLRGLTQLDEAELQQAEIQIREQVGLGRNATKEDGKEIPLGDVLNKYLAALEKHAADSVKVYGTPQSAELASVRNLFAHGKIFRSLKEEWVNVLEPLLWFLPLFNGLILKYVRVAGQREE